VRSDKEGYIEITVELNKNGRINIEMNFCITILLKATKPNRNVSKTSIDFVVLLISVLFFINVMKKGIINTKVGA